MCWCNVLVEQVNHYFLSFRCAAEQSRAKHSKKERRNRIAKHCTINTQTLYNESKRKEYLRNRWNQLIETESENYKERGASGGTDTLLKTSFVYMYLKIDRMYVSRVVSKNLINFFVFSALMCEWVNEWDTEEIKLIYERANDTDLLSTGPECRIPEQSRAAGHHQDRNK